MTGHLHLAYFATEITLHRCIIRSIASTGGGADTYLTHICRAAAKTRLISAMDFVNRLRSDHLTSFWYFPSKVNFALVATFGSLLLATAPCQEEADFYRARLGEYKWTLSVSAKNAGFLNFALESLESSTHLLKSLAQKPKLEDLDIRQVPPPPPPLPRLVPPDEDGELEDGEGDLMDESNGTSGDGGDVSDSPPHHHLPHATSAPVNMIHSSNFQNPAEYHGFRMMSPVTESTEPSGMEDLQQMYGKPFSGTAFEGLEARNWFDNSHHGSPEAERMGLLS